MIYEEIEDEAFVIEHKHDILIPSINKNDSIIENVFLMSI
jgi:hypothetical protein